VSKKTRSAHGARLVSPLPGERFTHGPVELCPNPIADDAGVISRPYRAINILAAMERRGAITARMRTAGDDFNELFRRAALDPLRAAPLVRQSRGRNEPSLALEVARERVWRAITAVGGVGSPGGSCLWHVVGWETSLKEWALGQGWNGRRVSQEAASGILIAALGALHQHFQGVARAA